MAPIFLLIYQGRETLERRHPPVAFASRARGGKWKEIFGGGKGVFDWIEEMKPCVHAGA